MPPILSFLLSAVIGVVYVGYGVRFFRRHAGPGRLLLEVTCAALAAFWLARALGYGVLLWTDYPTGYVNDVMRYSAYTVAIPAVMFALLDRWTPADEARPVPPFRRKLREIMQRRH